MAEPRRADRGEEGDVAGARILIVEARFYDDIADALLAGARGVLEAEGVAFDRVSVPGSLEIPAAIAMALEAAESQPRPYTGPFALGCVVCWHPHHFYARATPYA